MTTKTFTVTVSNPGSGNRYYLDGVLQAIPSLAYGATYRFDQSDSSNSGHPLRLSATSDGTHGGGSEYTVGVTTVGTPGSAGAYTEIQIANSAPSPLYYYCSVHSGMGSYAYIYSDSWGALTWGADSWGNQGNVSETITGFSLTSSIGTETTSANSDVLITGIELTSTNAGAVGGASVDVFTGSVNASFELGQVVTGFGVGITGNTMTSDIGTITIDEDLLIGAGWGRDTWGSLAWGDNFSVQVTGLELTSTIGEESAFTDFTQEVTGSELNLTQGLFSIISDVGITVFAAEDQIDASIGSVINTADANVTVTSVGELSSSIGQVVPEPKLEVPVTGISLTSTIGNFTLVQSTVEGVTGQELTFSMGEEDAVSVAEVTGSEATISVGSAEVIIDVSFDVTGISATISISQVGLTSWQEIDPGVNNVWSDVDLAA